MTDAFWSNDKMEKLVVREDGSGCIAHYNEKGYEEGLMSIPGEVLLAYSASQCTALIEEIKNLSNTYIPNTSEKEWLESCLNIAGAKYVGKEEDNGTK